MTRLSDEEIENILLAKILLEDTISTRRIGLKGFRSAESIYIPQIEKLQGEIERLKEYEWKYKELCK